MVDNDNKYTVMEFGNPGNNFHHGIARGRLKVKQDYFSEKLKYFKKIYCYSFGKGEQENIKFCDNVEVLYNKSGIHSFIYAFMLPFLFFKKLKEADVYNPRQMSCSLYAIYGKFFTRKPVVLHCGYDWDEFAVLGGEKKTYQWFVKAWCYITYKLADAFVVTSERHKRKIKKYAPNKEVVVLRNAVDLNIFKPLGLERNKNTLMFVGRLEHQKNLINLLKSLTLTKNKVKLKMAGKGSQEQMLRNLANELNVDVEFLGHINNKELADNYHNKETIFILPSFFEGHSNSLTEAMACGIPVITSKCDGNTEIVEHEKTGLIAGYEPEELAEAIDRYIDNPDLRKKCSENAVAMARDVFDVSKRIKTDCEILLKYAKRNSKHG